MDWLWGLFGFGKSKDNAFGSAPDPGVRRRDRSNDGEENGFDAILDAIRSVFKAIAKMFKILVGAFQLLTGNFSGALSTFGEAFSGPSSSDGNSSDPNRSAEPPWYQRLWNSLTGAANPALKGSTDLNSSQGHQPGAWERFKGGVSEYWGKFTNWVTGGHSVSQQVKDAINNSAEKRGLNPLALAALVHVETGGKFDPRAKNPGSTARGLGQFLESTGRQYGLLTPEDCYDPVKSCDALAQFWIDNGTALENGLHRKVDNREHYLAHQQGAAGALALLQNPDENVVLALTRAGISAEEAADRVRRNGGDTSWTAGQFANKWMSEYDKAYAMVAQANPAPAPSGSRGQDTEEPVSVRPVSNRTDTGRPNYGRLRQDGMVQVASAQTPGSKGTIVLDPGHGGKINGVHDPGTLGIFQGRQVTEAQANWDLTLDIKRELVALGYQVVLTKDDVDSDEAARDSSGSANPMAARRTSIAPDALMFVSIHQDSRGANGSPGIQVNYNRTARDVDVKAASALAHEVRGTAVQNERNIAVLHPRWHEGSGSLQQPAVLIEASNFSDPDSVRTVVDPGQRQEMARRIARGLAATLNRADVRTAMVKKDENLLARKSYLVEHSVV